MGSLSQPRGNLEPLINQNMHVFRLLEETVDYKIHIDVQKRLLVHVFVFKSIGWYYKMSTIGSNGAQSLELSVVLNWYFEFLFERFVCKIFTSTACK